MSIIENGVTSQLISNIAIKQRVTTKFDSFFKSQALAYIKQIGTTNLTREETRLLLPKIKATCHDGHCNW